MSSFQPMPPKRRPSLLLRAKIIYVCLFMVVWLTALTAGHWSQSCRNPDKSVATRLRGCNIAISLRNLFPGERQKLASAYLERGILRANTGETELARADMAEALDRATDGQADRAIEIWAAAVKQKQETIRDRNKGPRPYRDNPGAWLARLFARMQAEPDGSPAKRIWAEVVIKAQGG